MFQAFFYPKKDIFTLTMYVRPWQIPYRGQERVLLGKPGFLIELSEPILSQHLDLMKI